METQTNVYTSNIAPAVEAKPLAGGTNNKANLRHYVELKYEKQDDLSHKETGEPAQTALCGYVWDRLNVQHNGQICQECVEISKTKPRR